MSTLHLPKRNFGRKKASASLIGVFSVLILSSFIVSPGKGSEVTAAAAQGLTLSQQPSWWYIVKDLVIPLVTAGFLLWLGTIFKNRFEKLQQESQVMQGVILSEDRRDISFLTALAGRFALHLSRWHTRRGQGLDTRFDEIAAFYFSSVLSVARVNFLATAGSVLYPRLWLESAYHGLLRYVVEAGAGGEDQNPVHEMEEEAVLYKYFGGGAATSRVLTQSAAGGDVPVLFDLLKTLESTGEDDGELKSALRNAFTTFRQRFEGGKIKCTKVYLAAETLQTIDLYSFNVHFAKWYGEKKKPLPLRCPPKAPSEFSTEWTGKEGRAELGWKLMRRIVDFGQE